MDLDLGARVTLSTTMRPAMVAYAAVLQLPAQGLDELVERELGENPALERDDRIPEGDDRVAARDDRVVAQPQQQPQPSGGPDRIELEDDGFDALRTEARLAVEGGSRHIVEYVVASLDERGRLSTTPADIAGVLGVSLERVAEVLDVVRAVGPPGVAASDLRHCLLLQLDAWQERIDAREADARQADVRVVENARAIVDRQLDALGDGKFASIAAALGTTVDEVRAAAHFIRAELTPFAGMNARTWPPRATSARPCLQPDFVFVSDPDMPCGIAVRVAEEERHALVISPAYRSAVRRAPSRTSGRAHGQGRGDASVQHRSDAPVQHGGDAYGRDRDEADVWDRSEVYARDREEAYGQYRDKVCGQERGRPRGRERGEVRGGDDGSAFSAGSGEEYVSGRGDAAGSDDGLVADQLARARGFLARLQQRWDTMRLVGEAVAERQHDFLLGKAAVPGPLTRAEIALAIGVHESTVSRAVAGRWALLPSGGTLPMAELFGVCAAPMEVVRQVVASETRPLSDSEIAQLTSAAGHPMARRTVAKYRTQLGIPPSSRR